MPTIEQSIEVSAPLSTVYNQWTQFEEFPKFMEGIERIEQTDETHMHWVANFGGKTHEWDATIVEQDPDQRVAWKSNDGKFNAGVATFHHIDENKTRIMVQMDWEPEGALEKIGGALNFDDRRVKGDLERFKEMIESTGRESGAYRGEVGETAGA